LRLFSFGCYGLALAALALVVFGAIECPPSLKTSIFFLNIFFGGGSLDKNLAVLILPLEQYGSFLGP